MTIGPYLVKLGAVAGAAVAVLAGIAVPGASASSSVKGYSEDPTRFGGLTSCQHVFTGSVTSDNGSAGTVASLGQVTFGFCQAGTSVVPNALPWTLNIRRNSSYTIKGFDVTVATRQGTCRYSGTVNGFMQFPGVYSLSGLLSRQSPGCGGQERLNITNSIEVIGVNE